MTKCRVDELQLPRFAPAGRVTSMRMWQGLSAGTNSTLKVNLVRPIKTSGVAQPVVDDTAKSAAQIAL